MPLFLNIFVPLLFNALYGEYVVRIPLPDRVFLPCGHELDFGIISLCDNSIEQKKKIIRLQQRFRVFVRIIRFPVVKLLTCTNHRSFHVSPVIFITWYCR